MHLEVLVTFQDAQERNYFFSKAKNLASYRDESGNPTAGLRIDVPPYLMPTFKLLTDHGYDIRRAHGTETTDCDREERILSDGCRKTSGGRELATAVQDTQGAGHCGQT